MGKKRTLVIGDIHGAHKALTQCLNKSKFDYDSDTLVVLGDICDGWPYVKECVEMLRTIPKLIGHIGNHDLWAMEWARTGKVEGIWHGQGGKQTIASFSNDHKQFPLKWFEKFGYLSYSNDQVFVHAGIDPNQKDLRKQKSEVCAWDRSLVYNAYQKHSTKPNFKYGGWKDIFVGHTVTQRFGSHEPLHLCNIWMLDTGCGWGNKLTIMDIDTNEYWQSDRSQDLYPGVEGRQ